MDECCRYQGVSHKEESIVRQMEEVIVARTVELQKTMSAQAGDAANKINYLMDCIRGKQDEVFAEQVQV